MPDTGAIGPRREQTGDPVSGFDHAVGSLSDGGLLIPAVLSLAKSAVLARNAGPGSAAEHLFGKEIAGMHYRVKIAAMVPGQPELGDGSIIDTVAHGINPLTALLESLLDEIADLHERRGRTP